MKSPFKFLDSYTKEDRGIFFGRDREIEELYQRVFESKLMLVYGVSGTGKSSLIHCGLANKFQETDWLPLVIRRGGNIINSMAGAVQNATITKQEGQILSPVQFKKAVRSLYLDHYKPVFFIFDQFEELFIFGDKEERKSFVQIIKSLIESDIQCRLIFVMREEYMAGVTEFERYIPTFFANRVRIEKMAHTNAVEAINGPCKAAGITLEEGFPEALLERLSPEGADVELTYLQVFLDKMYRLAGGFLPPSIGHLSLGEGDGGELKGGSSISGPESKGSLSFSLNILQKSGNVSDLLGSFLDEQISLLSDPDSALAVLKSFVSVKGTKRQMTSEEVKEYAQTLGKPVTDSVLLEMLQTFIHLRILRDKDQNERYELRHDALATKIYEKITLVEKEILEIRQFIENAWNSWQKRKVLISATDLDYIAPYESRLFLSKELSGLIDESRERLTRAKRRRRSVFITSTFALFVILTVFIIWALKEKKKADVAGIRQLESILKLNENFRKVIASQSQRKNEIYGNFQRASAQNPVKARGLENKALQIQKAANELTDFINQIEYLMISKTENISSDSAKRIDLSMVKQKSNADIPNQILFGTNDNPPISNVILLKKKIQDYRKTVYDQIDRRDWDKLVFSIETEKLIHNNMGDSVTWENANFQETVLAGAVTNLNNLIMEINNIEIEAADLIYNQITMEGFKFDVIEVKVIPKTTYVMLGGNYEAEAIIYAYNSKQNMEAYLFDGQDPISVDKLPNTSDMVPLISKNGKININIPAKNLGPKKYSGYIYVRRYDGDFSAYPFSGEYSVGNPPTIEISTTRANVLYRGVENSIQVTIPGIPKDKISLSATNGYFNSGNSGSFNFIPGKEDISQFTASANVNKRLFSFPPVIFRIIDFPDPVGAIGNNISGLISKQDILESPGINLKLANSDSEIKFEIESFTVMTQDPSGLLREENTKGSAFSEKQRMMISNLEKGRHLFIKDLKVVGPDGKSREIKGMIYKIA